MIQTCSNSILKQVPLPRCPRQKGQSPDPFPIPLRSQKETSRHQEHRNKNYKDLKQTMHKWNCNLRHLFAKICCKVQKVSSATLLNTMVLQRKCPAFGKSLIEALSFLVFFWPRRSVKFQPCFKDFQDRGSIPFAFVPMPIPKPSPVHVRFQVSKGGTPIWSGENAFRYTFFEVFAHAFARHVDVTLPSLSLVKQRNLFEGP